MYSLWKALQRGQVATNNLKENQNAANIITWRRIEPSPLHTPHWHTVPTKLKYAEHASLTASVSTPHGLEKAALAVFPSMSFSVVLWDCVTAKTQGRGSSPYPNEKSGLQAQAYLVASRGDNVGFLRAKVDL